MRERGRKREEGCGDVEMEWNDVKLISVWWKELTGREVKGPEIPHCLNSRC